MDNDRRDFLKLTTFGAVGAALANPLKSSSSNGQGLFFTPGANGGAMSNTSDSIRRIRMREVEIQLLDHLGNPLKNKSVEVLQTKHSFLFGDCNPNMNSMYRMGQAAAEKLDVYRKLFSGTLNAVNSTCYWTERPKNNMAKTEAFQGEFKLDGFSDTVDWGIANGLTVKGHPLFWTVPKAVPDWMSKYDYPTKLKFLEVRLRSLVGRFKGNENSKVGKIKNVTFYNISGSCQGTSRIEGFPEKPLENIKFNDIAMTIYSESLPDKRATHGFLAHDVSNLSMYNCDHRWNEEKPEPNWSSAFFFENIQDLRLDKISGKQASDTNHPALLLTNLRNGIVERCYAKPETKTFIQVSGKTTQNLTFRNNYLKNARVELERAENVNTSELNLETAKISNNDKIVYFPHWLCFFVDSKCCSTEF